MNNAKIRKWLDLHSDLRMLQAGVCDLNGILRGKRMPIAQLSKVLDGQMKLPLSLCQTDIWGQDISGSELIFDSGDIDGACVWTGRGPFSLPGVSQSTAFVPLSLCHAGGDLFKGDSRNALVKVREQFAQKGWRVEVATELEFYLVALDDGVPKPATGCWPDEQPKPQLLSLSESQRHEAFFEQLYQTCESFSVPADALISEGGAGQYEVNLLHVDALDAADNTFYFKQIAQSVARKLGLQVTFMAKPFLAQSGSGMHVHFSVWDEQGVNLFDDGTDKGSTLMRAALGGLIALMSESMLLFAPHANSYRRFRPDSHAPVLINWGYENRTTALRIPNGPFHARRIEHRVAGADANPYLVIAAILGAAYHGMTQNCSPGDAVEGDGSYQGSEGLPDTWSSALAVFTRGHLLSQVLSDELIGFFAATKRQEIALFENHISRFEYDTYLRQV